MELGIGRGGDLGKMRFSSIASLTGLDISKQSLEECKDRYNENSDKNPYPLTLIHGDFCTQSVNHLINHKMHLVTCQFSMHYSFATGQTAQCFFQTVSSFLEPGFFYAATIPNAIAIVFDIFRLFFFIF